MALFDYAPAPESRDIANLKPSYRPFINGEFVDGAGEPLKTVNPESKNPMDLANVECSSFASRHVEFARTDAEAADIVTTDVDENDKPYLTDIPYLALPWVGRRSPRWEPEPLRWLGANAGLRAMTVADAEERLTGRQSISARLMSPFLGH